MHRYFLRVNAFSRKLTLAAESGIIRVENNRKRSLVLYSYAIACPCYGSEIADCDYAFSFFVRTDKCRYGVVAVVADEPFKALPRVVDLPQRRAVTIELIESSRESFKRAVRVVVEQKPVELFFLLPLDELPELLPHEQQLLAGMGVHICRAFY